jgi:hypothetical protein
MSLKFTVCEIATALLLASFGVNAQRYTVTVVGGGPVSWAPASTLAVRTRVASLYSTCLPGL